MQLDKYHVTFSDDHTIYEFVSSGPRGQIRKVVAFSVVRNAIYNLGFGDVEESTGEWTDQSISDNGDYRKILATVAITVADFLTWHPEAVVFAEGSTDLRNHLYRRGIERILDEIEEGYLVQGYTEDNGWEPFERNRHYKAFLIQRVY